MALKILFVIDNLEYGGGERGFLQIIKGLHKKYDLSVVANPGGLFCDELEKIGTRLYPLAMNRQLSLKRFKILKNLIKREGFDIVHGQGSRAEFYARIACAMSGDVYYVSTIQAPVEKFEVDRLRKQIYLLFETLTRRFVDKFIVVSDELKKLLIDQHRVNPSNVIKIPNGIEVDKIQPVKINLSFRKRLGISPDELVVGAVGRLIWAKGFSHLIDAFRTVRQVLPMARLIIAGEGPMKEDLMDRARFSGVGDSIRFSGFIKDIPSLMAAIDVLAVTSLSEGFPMVTLEGMAMAKPIIATSLPGILEQIKNGKTGLLVPPGDSKALCRGIIELLTNKEKAKDLGREAREYVSENFSAEKMISKTDQLYQGLLSG